jgi:hypothetical protein
MGYEGLPLIINTYNTDSSGFTPSAICNVAHSNSDYKGFMFAGLWNYVGGTAKGVNVAGFINYVEDMQGPLVQIGLFNRIGEYNEREKPFVLQIGLFNKVGDQTSAIVNLRGTKKLTDIIKQACKKKCSKSSPSLNT